MSHISRRDFLMGTAAVITAGMALEGESSSAKAKTPQGPPIKCGIIGTGVQGRKLIRELTRMPGVEIVAVCDIYERNLQRGAKSIGKEVHTYTDYKQMLDSEKDMQAVIIATPPALHVPMSIDALQAGKHVFCEAPLALDIEECKRMVRTVRQSDRIFQVGHQRRYNRLYKHALKFVKTGAISRVVQVRAQWHRKDSWRRVVSNRAHEKLLNWRLYKATSGGLLAEYGSHQLDVINWFLKKTPISVVGYAGIDVWKDGREVPDNLQVLFEYPNGVKVAYTATLSNTHEFYYELFLGTHGAILLSREKSGLWFKEADAPEMGWEIYARKEKLGDELGIVLDPDASKYAAQLREGKRIEGERTSKDKTKNAFYLELEDFFKCIREGKQPACGAMEAMQAAVTVIIANQALEQGKKIVYQPDWFEV